LEGGGHRPETVGGLDPPGSKSQGIYGRGGKKTHKAKVTGDIVLKAFVIEKIPGERKKASTKRKGAAKKETAGFSIKTDWR